MLIPCALPVLTGNGMWELMKKNERKTGNSLLRAKWRELC